MGAFLGRSEAAAELNVGVGVCGHQRLLELQLDEALSM